MKLLSLMSWLPFPLLLSTNNAIRLHDFSATIPRCYEHVYIKSFFNGTVSLWNSLPADCSPLAYDGNIFKCTVFL